MFCDKYAAKVLFSRRFISLKSFRFSAGHAGRAKQYELKRMSTLLYGQMLLRRPVPTAKVCHKHSLQQATFTRSYCIQEPPASSSKLLTVPATANAYSKCWARQTIRSSWAHLQYALSLLDAEIAGSSFWRL